MEGFEDTAETMNAGDETMGEEAEDEEGVADDEEAGDEMEE